MFKIILEVGGERAFAALSQLVPVLCRLVVELSGEDVNVSISKGRLASAEVRVPRVQYRAIGTSEALQALGQTTVVGLIYSHILEHGPCTVADIRRDKFYGAKSVESSIHKLKHMGLVAAEPVQPQE